MNNLDQTMLSLSALFEHRPHLQCVLFDLDGTVADTATDLSMPVNEMRIERGMEPLPLSELRPFASTGARGLLKKGLGVTVSDADFESMRDEFLRRYEYGMCNHTQLFDGIGELLDQLDRRQIRWGIVSNKVEKYVRPICDHLGIAQRSSCMIGGDTTGYPKPHPRPLLFGAELSGVDPLSCIYLGDDRRDIEAAHAAGMGSIACGYGYCGDEDPPSAWGADRVVHSPRELLR